MNSNTKHLARLPLAGSLLSTDFRAWAPELRKELESNKYNGVVGHRLLSQSDRVRVWTIDLPPGNRVPFHRHVLDYFWTATASGTSIQRTHDGSVREVSYAAGETRHFSFSAGEFLIHDLENTGTTTLAFLTVELLDGANKPLPLPSSVNGASA